LWDIKLPILGRVSRVSSQLSSLQRLWRVRFWCCWRKLLASFWKALLPCRPAFPRYVALGLPTWYRLLANPSCFPAHLLRPMRARSIGRRSCQGRSKANHSTRRNNLSNQPKAKCLGRKTATALYYVVSRSEVLLPLPSPGRRCVQVFSSTR
jgi:hypothetical protein